MHQFTSRAASHGHGRNRGIVCLERRALGSISDRGRHVEGRIIRLSIGNTDCRNLPKYVSCRDGREPLDPRVYSPGPVGRKRDARLSRVFPIGVRETQVALLRVRSGQAYSRGDESRWKIPERSRRRVVASCSGEPQLLDRKSVV